MLGHFWARPSDRGCIDLRPILPFICTTEFSELTLKEFYSNQSEDLILGLHIL